MLATISAALTKNGFTVGVEERDDDDGYVGDVVVAEPVENEVGETCGEQSDGGEHGGSVGVVSPEPAAAVHGDGHARDEGHDQVGLDRYRAERWLCGNSVCPGECAGVPAARA